MAGSGQRGTQVRRRKPATQADWGQSRFLKSKCNHGRRLVAGLRLPAPDLCGGAASRLWLPPPDPLQPVGTSTAQWQLPNAIAHSPLRRRLRPELVVNQINTTGTGRRPRGETATISAKSTGHLLRSVGMRRGTAGLEPVAGFSDAQRFAFALIPCDAPLARTGSRGDDALPLAIGVDVPDLVVHRGPRVR